MTGYDLMEGLVTVLECCGNGYFEDVKEAVEGSKVKTPSELWPIRPDRLKPVPAKDGHGIDHWEFQLRSHTRKTIFKPDEIIPFRYFSPMSDWFGMGSLQPAVDAIALDKQMSAWNKDFFQHGTTAEGLISTDKPLTQKEMTDLGVQIKSFLTGKFRKILILGKNLKWQSISVSPKDAEFLQGRKDARDAMLAALGVPLAKLGFVTDVKYSNYELQNLSFHRDCIIPKLLKIEGVLNKYLVPLFPDSEGLYVEFDKTSLLKEDENQLVDRFGKALRSGFITPNEACRRLGWPAWPEEQPGGDRYYMERSLVEVCSEPAQDASGLGFGGALPEDQQLNQQLNKRLDSIEDAALDAIRDMKDDILADVEKRIGK
jgi:HK97 family phage portal protein